MDFGFWKKLRRNVVQVVILTVGIVLFGALDSSALDADAFGRLVIENCDKAHEFFIATPTESRSELLKKVDVILRLPMNDGIASSGPLPPFGFGPGSDALARREKFDRAQDTTAKTCAADITLLAGDMGLSLIAAIGHEATKVGISTDVRRKLEDTFVVLTRLGKEKASLETIAQLTEMARHPESNRLALIALVALRETEALRASFSLLSDDALAALLLRYEARDDRLMSELANRASNHTAFLESPISHALSQNVVFASWLAIRCAASFSAPVCSDLHQLPADKLLFVNDQERAAMVLVANATGPSESLRTLLRRLKTDKALHTIKSVLESLSNQSLGLILEEASAEYLNDVQNLLIRRENLASDGIHLVLSRIDKPRKELVNKIQSDLLAVQKFDAVSHFWEKVSLPLAAWKIRIKEKEVCNAFWIAAEPAPELFGKVAASLSSFPTDCIGRLKARNETWAQELVLFHLLLSSKVTKPILEQLPHVGIIEKQQLLDELQKRKELKKVEAVRNQLDEAAVLPKIQCDQLLKSTVLIERLREVSGFYAKFSNCIIKGLQTSTSDTANNSGLWALLDRFPQKEFVLHVQPSSEMLRNLDPNRFLLLSRRNEFYPVEFCRAVFQADSEREQFALCEWLFLSAGFSHRDEVRQALAHERASTDANELNEFLQKLFATEVHGLDDLATLLAEGDTFERFLPGVMRLSPVKRYALYETLLQSVSISKLAEYLAVIVKYDDAVPPTLITRSFERLSLASKKPGAFALAWKLAEAGNNDAIYFLLRFENVATLVAKRRVFAVAHPLDPARLEALLLSNLQ